jgi:hypothetical protein
VCPVESLCWAKRNEILEIRALVQAVQERESERASERRSERRRKREKREEGEEQLACRVSSMLRMLTYADVC